MIDTIIIVFVSIWIGWKSAATKTKQWIRLIDIFIYAPFLVYAAHLHPIRWIKMGLLILAATTFSYNLHNYLSHR